MPRESLEGSLDGSESLNLRSRVQGSAGQSINDSHFAPSSVPSPQPHLITDDDGDWSMTSGDDEQNEDKDDQDEEEEEEEDDDDGGVQLHRHLTSVYVTEGFGAQVPGQSPPEFVQVGPSGLPIATAAPLVATQLPPAWSPSDAAVASPDLLEADIAEAFALQQNTMPIPLPPPFFEPLDGMEEVPDFPEPVPAPPSGTAIMPPVTYQPPPNLTTEEAAAYLQNVEQTIVNPLDASILPFQHLAPFLHPDPGVIDGNNYNLADFLFNWSRRRGYTGGPRNTPTPYIDKVDREITTPITHVQYADLQGDHCDMQGLDWHTMGVKREHARINRDRTYRNYTNMQYADRVRPADKCLPNTDSFFRFRRMDFKRDMLLMHFQLRNVMATTSRAETFYTASRAVIRFDPVSGVSKTIMKTPYTQVSTLAAKYGILMAGCFNGEYLIHNLDSGSDRPRCERGTVTKDTSGITNHIQIHGSRTRSGPVATIASNDMGVRVLDLETQTWLSSVKFHTPVNCTAVSPDHRLRVVVGDDTGVYIVPVDECNTGRDAQVLYKLDAHRDAAFACDWADDGWTVATGCQDRTVKIWDARMWTTRTGEANPIHSTRSEMACVRSLHFSPIGSGKRVLAAIEEADMVNIIDAQTFASKQRFDIIGELGGAGFTGDGQNLHVLCTDFTRGGIIQLERCGLGRDAAWGAGQSEATYDWPQSCFTEHKRVQQSLTRRRRMAAALDAMDPF